MSENKKIQEIIEEESVVIEENEMDTPEEQPVFYNPVRVLQLDEWLNGAAIAMVAATIASNLFSISDMSQNMAILVTQTTTPNTLAWVLTVLLFILIVGASSAVYYFPLRALGKILKVLMEMEYNSRGVKE
jgi:hypothetical protein